ncbi:hypothetical protein [Aneurinibacillus sp. REN35]|uniref:hypothetical protein n=1 Tax=Aneurinibacillus sp. REN35 TaxID=3237286 RepID=UPI0035279D94
MDKHEKLEQEMAHLLTEGKMKSEDPNTAAVKRLPARYEVRIQTMTDPIAEETKIYRSMAEEIDDRYDKYANKTTLVKRGETMKEKKKQPDLIESLDKNYERPADREQERDTGRVEGLNVYEQAYREEKE